MKLKQISVFIENSPARLYKVTNALADAGINLRALNIVDVADYGVLRLLVSDLPKARRILMDMDIPARVEDVVAVELEDRPGQLAQLIRPLWEADVWLMYMYSFIGPTEGKAVMVCRFNDNDRAIEVLESSGCTLLDSDNFNRLDSSQ